MRILVAHSRYRSTAPSGENRVVDRETAALRRAGHEVRQLERDSDDIATWSRLRRVSLPAQVIWNREAYRTTRALVEDFQPDVVHIHNIFPLLSPSVVHACHDAGAPAVVTLHNYKLLCASGDFFREGAVCHDCATGSSARALTRGCYRSSSLATAPVVLGNRVNRDVWQNEVSAYICVSHAQRRALAAADLPDHRTFVKWNLVPPVVTSGRGRDHRALYLGRLDDAKGLRLLMAAWDEHRRRSPGSSLGLDIVGSGPLDAEVARWSAARSEVRYHGQVTPAGVHRFLEGAGAIVLPSVWEETFGLVVVEAMSAGTPAIAADHGSFPELVVSGVTGELFPPSDAMSLASCLDRLDIDPERFAQLGRGARQRYLNLFDADDNLEQLLAIYRFAIAHPVHGDTCRPAPVPVPGALT